jgi:hypothetical protein
MNENEIGSSIVNRAVRLYKELGFSDTKEPL